MICCLNALDERHDTITRIKWKEDVLDTCGSAFGHMGEEGREGGDWRRQYYYARLMGSAFRPHDLNGLGGVQNKGWAECEVMKGQIKLSGRQWKIAGQFRPL